MKALVVITGRGLGGDASIALNTIKALEKQGVECEIALDKSAPGILFKNNGYSWHKISIPVAGGFVATKKSAIKAAFKMINATFEIRKLIKKLDVDFVLGVIGGGAIVGSVGAKLAGKPAASIICTPLDTKVCTKFNPCFVLPEANLYKHENLPKGVSKTYFPVNHGLVKGDKNKALEKLREEKKFDENKRTILFSSGSSIFKGMIEGANNFAELTDDYNLVLIGLPLHDDYLDNLNENIIYLGYINWLSDLFDYIDLAVVTDDGLTIQEAVACEVPSISLTRIKWGRYHNMEEVFKGATIEAEVYNLNDKIKEALDIADDLRAGCKKYSADIAISQDLLAERIIEKVKK
ncbi:MAG: glycosyltransferase [Methanobrevibacter sp.]|uniref:glycosyltransferase n=1 Tax=Methanobrevibacter sp. TaxID=66852 RepID=UPI0026E0FF19|nr:glycosyltransferase [Methanobrevibacter sp.]MDO5848459.1 glycosyltransferase [Methanobrevibacter sp.]